MSYQALPMKCTACGETPARIEEVGLSSDHELVIHWWCGSCRRVVNSAIALTGCWELCPAPDMEVEAEAVESADARFLLSLGIRG